ncbi:hypothetical protein PG997_012924 [Apiospora hydei]|uniref:Uncharacterized protein n=1 Tax=Apiospora hydei TaxID=1337664 RepID=A0ABR1V4R7_9PEZI
MSTSNKKPTILLLCLGDKWMTSMLDDPQAFGEGIDILLEKAILKRAKTLSGALKYLDQNKPDGILVTDPGVVAPSNREILRRLTAFAQSGGTVVFSFSFASNIRADDMDRLWQESWNLPWTMGNYNRSTFQLNTSALGTSTAPDSDGDIRGQSLLWPEYSQKAVHLDNVARENCWYLPTGESRIESMVFPPDRVTNHSQTPVAFTRAGEGFVGYTGDVNQERGTNLVLLRMFNLDIKPVVEEL